MVLNVRENALAIAFWMNVMQTMFALPAKTELGEIIAAVHVDIVQQISVIKGVKIVCQTLIHFVKQGILVVNVNANVQAIVCHVHAIPLACALLVKMELGDTIAIRNVANVQQINAIKLVKNACSVQETSATRDIMERSVNRNAQATVSQTYVTMTANA